MAKQTNNSPPIVRLQYKSGDLIFKEGGYGNVLYRIISGRVELWIIYKNKRMKLATLGPGEVIGEVSYFVQTRQPYPFSARVIDDATLEVWHMHKLFQEFESMPPIFSKIASQALNRLYRTRHLMIRLNQGMAVKKEEERQKKLKDQRRYYRKEVDFDCVYRPANGESAKWINLSGRVKDISREGMGLQASGPNILQYSHNVGEKFEIEMILPNKAELRFEAMILSAKKMDAGNVFFGMSIIEISHNNKKRLGFYLMP